MSAEKKSNNNIERVQEKLQSIKSEEGIIGYILRGPNSASIDLKNPKKIIDYATLSATAFEVGQEMSAMFENGEVDSIIMEGENTRILSIVAKDHRLSIFMEKNVDHTKLCKDLNLP